MKIACEIFADRNYEDDGNLVSRKKPHALITDPEEAKKHVLNMVKNQSLNCHSGKQIPCEIDSVCIHGDNESSLATARSIKENLLDAFKESGIGIGNSYVGIPSLRIDYILHDKKFNSYNYKKNKYELSDHFPISCSILIP